MIIEHRTIKETMVCKVAAKSSSWSWGGLCGIRSSERARVETNMAPTPIWTTDSSIRNLHPAGGEDDGRTYGSWNRVSLPPARSQTITPTKMPSEQSLLPSVYLLNPLVKRKQSWYPTERQDTQE